MDGPMVPTLADIAWIVADEEETYARVRYVTSNKVYRVVPVRERHLSHGIKGSRLVAHYPLVCFQEWLSSSEAWMEAHTTPRAPQEFLCAQLPSWG